jgi:plastocyanin
MLRVLLAVPAAAAALAAGALPALAGPSPARAPSGPAPSRAPARATVTLKDIAFNPARVAIRRGGTVTFRWADGDSPHNVTPARRGPRLRRLATRKSGSAAVRLTRRGTYRFICTIHPGMAGRIVVR